HGLGALLRERLVLRRGAGVVGVSFDRDLDRVVTLELIGDPGQRRLRALLQRALAAVEEDARRERDDEAALLAARGGDAGELVLHPQASRLGVALGELLSG